jgi:SPP1 family predicted phage head-tail adaptor
MNAGTLNRRITIQQRSQAQDEFGQPTDSWTDFVSTWAGIRAATSKEVYAASGFTSQVTHVITIRYRKEVVTGVSATETVNSSQRVVYQNRVFQIQAVTDPDEGKVWLNLLCIEIADGAR